MRRALLVVGLTFFGALAPARAEDCSPEGAARTEQLCAPGRDMSRCSKRVARMNQRCAALEEKLKRDLLSEDPMVSKLAAAGLKALAPVKAATKTFDDATPDYKSDAYERAKKGGGGDSDAASDPSGALGRAGEAIEDEDFEAAQAAATQAIEAAPEDPAAWMARAQARSLAGEREGARQDARRALSLRPTAAQGQAAMTILGGEGDYARGAAKIKTQKLDFGAGAAPSNAGAGAGSGASAARAKTAERAAPNMSEGNGQASSSAQAARAAQAAGAPELKNEAADRAFSKLMLRDHSGAYDEATRAIAHRPDDARARTLRAVAANRLGRHEQAADDASAALALKPKNVTALLERGFARYQMGRYAEALGDVDEALAEAPLNAMGYLYRGYILEKLERVSDAVAAYIKAGELDPALKPVSDEAQARLAGDFKTAAGPAAAGRRVAARWRLWAALAILALVLLARGLRRGVKPGWATPLALLLALAVCASSARAQCTGTVTCARSMGARECEDGLVAKRLACLRLVPGGTALPSDAPARPDNKQARDASSVLRAIDDEARSKGLDAAVKARAADGASERAIKGDAAPEKTAAAAPEALTPAQIENLAPDVQDAARQVSEGDAAGARVELERAAERHPESAAVQSLLSRARHAAGDVEGAKQAARAALRLDPQDYFSRLLVGHEDELAAGAGRLNGLKAGFPDAAAVEKAVALQSLVGVSAAPIQRQAAERALAFAAAGISPEAAPRTQAQALLQKAAARIALGDLTGPDGAIFNISRALMLDPKNVEARILRAHVSNLPRVRNYKAAVLDADAALALAPGSAAAYFEKGCAELQLGQIQQALRDIEQGLALEPDNAMGRLYHAMALEKANLIAKAIDEYQAAARLDPALKPVVDEALGVLAGTLAGPKENPAPRPAPRASSIPTRTVLSVLIVLTALGLILEGGKRVFYKDWKTSVAAPAALSSFPADGTLAPGAVLGGNFRIERELARGGLGIVYEAVDLVLKRRVAIKQLNRDATQSEEVRRRFVQEAQLAARLRHPHLAEIFSVVSEGGLYLVFELVEGEDLSSTLQARGKLPLPEIKSIAADIASALDYAHSERVIHRDLKPANIMVAGGRAKIMDFGIAHQARSMTDATQTQAWGTPPYMAPEQEMGRVCKESDLYALGVMLYELATGRRPFAGPSFLEQKLAGDFTPPRRLNAALPAALDAFFKKALAPDPAHRFHSAAELVEAFPAVASTPNHGLRA